MSQNQIALIALISPLLFIATAIVSWFQSGSRPTLLKQMSLIVGLLGIGTAVISGYFVFQHGLIQSSLIGLNNFGLSIRLDAISVTMLTMIALLAFIVLKFSNNYMDGDERQGSFMGRLAATIASVQLLVISGNLGLLFIAWVFTSISLHRLLLFYPERPGAIIAARKKFILARVGDASLLVAITLLYNLFGSGNLEAIFNGIRTGMAPANMLTVEFAALFLALAAMFKSAKFPTHGWLIEVMETPTPVSALLHAGLLNAGPYLIIRMAFVMDASFYAPLLLIAVGGFTALFASVVFLTQSSIKTALGYSSVAHMGFSLMVCGLGVYTAAMLHLVAHSFYKAHAFLSTGSVIDVIRASKIEKAQRLGSPLRIAAGIILALLVYGGFAYLWGITEFGLLAIGTVIILGISRLFTTAIDSNGSFALFLRAVFFAVIVAAAFFSLESGMHYLLGIQVPELSNPTFATLALTICILALFTIAIFVQIISPTLTASPKFNALAIHLRNGLYMNAIFDKLVGTYSFKAKSHVPKAQEQPEELESEIELVPVRK